MIIQERNSKNLIIPKSLGNFATNGGGTGGVTPEEAAEIASAVTEAAIDAYDADLQTNLDGIRSAVSGNTDDIVALAGDVAALSGNVSALSASTESGLQSANAAAESAYTLASSAYTLASSAYTRGDSAYTLTETLSAATETALAGKQDTLTAGSGISIVNNVISCTVSGGSKDYYINWAELYNMDYAPRRAAFIELVDKYNDGYHIYASGLTAANGLNVVLPLVEFTSGTFVTDRYTGGWAKFGAINTSGSTSGYYGASFSSVGNIAPDRQYLTPERFYTLPQATASHLGGVKVGSGLTIDGNGVLSVSGGTGGDANVYYLDEMTQAELIALHNEIFTYTEFNFPSGNYRFFVTNRDNDEYQGRFEVFVARFYENTPVCFSGVMQSRYNNTLLQRGYELTSAGDFYSSYSANTVIPDPAYEPFVIAEYDNDMCLTGISHNTKASIWEGYKAEGKEGYARKTIIAYIHTGDVVPARFSLIYTEGDFSEDEGNAALYFGAVYNLVSDSSLHSVRFRLKKDIANDVYTVDNIAEYSYSRTS